jgi:hypothetical protein
MKTRSSARGEPRRLGNMGLLALMLCSLVALSLIRARFSPIGNYGFLFLLLLFAFYSFFFWDCGCSLSELISECCRCLICIPPGSTTGAEPVIKAEDTKPAAVASKAAVATDAGDNDVPDEVAAVAGKGIS